MKLHLNLFLSIASGVKLWGADVVLSVVLKGLASRMKRPTAYQSYTYITYINTTLLHLVDLITESHIDELWLYKIQFVCVVDK